MGVTQVRYNDYLLKVNTEWLYYGIYNYHTIDDMLRLSGVQSNYLRGRNNANNVDLNRNFPNLYKYKVDYDTRGVKDKNGFLFNETLKELNQLKQDCFHKPFQPETLAIIDWMSKIPFVLSANLHGGSLVANYPFDNSFNNLQSYSATADDELFKKLSKIYSKHHKTMGYANRSVCDSDTDGFPDGITNGAAWYPVCGSMQDFNYLGSNCFEITIGKRVTSFIYPD